MLKRTVVRNTVAAAAILLGLAVPASAQYSSDRTYSDEGYYGRPYYGPGYREPSYGGGSYGGGAGVVGGAGHDGRSACASRYRSYDPASGTYMGRDGRRHPCP